MNPWYILGSSNSGSLWHHIPDDDIRGELGIVEVTGWYSS